ncbi:MAG TPA: TolC family protein [Vicinamibacterales bacterium]|jgi:outer membrane protein TolC|nr:TolC family protein [Vicinamibacterales bacterium]
MPHGQLQSAALPLTLDEAIRRGVEFNTALLISGAITDQARAARLQQLSALLPKIDGSLRESRQKTNLLALGIGFPGVPPTVEVPNFDARVSVSASLFDLHAAASADAAAHAASAAGWDARDARETIVLAVATTYLQVLSAQATLESANSDRETAQALFDQAIDREKSGLVPHIDTLRASVQLREREQAVTQAQSTLDKQRIALLRIVGLPLQQPLTLTTAVPYSAAAGITGEEAVARAIEARADYKSAQAQTEAAELQARAATRERLPFVTFNGDAGALGTEPSNTLFTWSATALAHVPIFEGGRIAADRAQANALLKQRRAERDDMRVAIEQQVADALIDLRTASQQVDVATATVDLARQTLAQAQDRFVAGVTNNIEVVQAQETLVNANAQYISALYAHNLSKLTLARATGSVEGTWKDVLPTR